MTGDDIAILRGHADTVENVGFFRTRPLPAKSFNESTQGHAQPIAFLPTYKPNDIIEQRTTLIDTDISLGEAGRIALDVLTDAEAERREVADAEAQAEGM